MRNSSSAGRVRRDDVRRDAAFDEPDGVVRPSKHRILGQRDAAQHHQRVEQLVDRRLAELGKRRVRRAAARAQPHATARRASRAPSRLSVGSPLIRNLTPPGACAFADARAVAAALLADDEQQADARFARRAQSLDRRDLRGENAFRVARAAAVEHARSSTRLGKNGGTQSKCVEKTTRGAASSCAKTLKRPSRDRLLGDGVAALAQVRRRARADFLLAAGRRVDVDERRA